MRKPELLLPAGSLEKVKVAFLYGAEAVYVGNPVFSLRKYSPNLNVEELQVAITLARALGKKIYVAVNALAHPQDLEQLKPFLAVLQQLQPHGLIVADLGIFTLARALTNLPLHVSTQANVTNAATALFWQQQGAQRIVLARELSLDEIAAIRAQVTLELEVFVHGSMCAGYSGQCLISNYTSQRDANRGGCVQNCRHLYQIQSDSVARAATSPAYLMNSKDLRALPLLPDLIKIGVNSLKVEGRMKSGLYVANTARVYAQALNDLTKEGASGHLPVTQLKKYQAILKQVSNRGFCMGGLKGSLATKAINTTATSLTKKWAYVGTVKNVQAGVSFLVHVKAPFKAADQLFLLAPNLHDRPLAATSFFDLNGRPLTVAKPNSLVSFPWQPGVAAQMIMGVVRNAGKELRRANFAGISHHAHYGLSHHGSTYPIRGCRQ